MSEVFVYTTPTCPYCHKVKDWLTQHNIQFTEINVAEDHNAVEQMIKESGQSGVPVIKIQNQDEAKIIVGYDISALEKEFNK